MNFDDTINAFMTYNTSFPFTRIIDGYITSEVMTMDFDLCAPLVETDDGEAKVDNKSIIAYKKLMFWVESQLRHSIVCKFDDTVGNILDNEMDNVVLFSPQTPTDDVLIQLLHAKLSAISAGGVVIGTLRIKTTESRATFNFLTTKQDYSLLPDDVSYVGAAVLHDTQWWHRNDCSMMDFAYDDEDPESNYELEKELIEANDPLKEYERSLLNPDKKSFDTEIISISNKNTWKPKHV